MSAQSSNLRSRSIYPTISLGELEDYCSGWNPGNNGATANKTMEARQMNGSGNQSPSPSLLSEPENAQSIGQRSMEDHRTAFAARRTMTKRGVSPRRQEEAPGPTQPNRPRERPRAKSSDNSSADASTPVQPSAGIVHESRFEGTPPPIDGDSGHDPGTTPGEVAGTGSTSSTAGRQRDHQEIPKEEEFSASSPYLRREKSCKDIVDYSKIVENDELVRQQHEIMRQIARNRDEAAARGNAESPSSRATSHRPASKKGLEQDEEDPPSLLASPGGTAPSSVSTSSKNEEEPEGPDSSSGDGAGNSDFLHFLTDQSMIQEQERIMEQIMKDIADKRNETNRRFLPLRSTTEEAVAIIAMRQRPTSEHVKELTVTIEEAISNRSHSAVMSSPRAVAVPGIDSRPQPEDDPNRTHHCQLLRAFRNEESHPRHSIISTTPVKEEEDGGDKKEDKEDSTPLPAAWGETEQNKSVTEAGASSSSDKNKEKGAPNSNENALPFTNDIMVEYHGRNLKVRGTRHTWKSIEAGDATIVECRGCTSVMQVGSGANFLYCTFCGEVSPVLNNKNSPSAVARRANRPSAPPRGGTRASPAVPDSRIAQVVQQQEMDIAIARKLARLNNSPSIASS